MALTDALKAKLNSMCPAAMAALLGDEVATDGIIAAAISYATENPDAVVSLLSSVLTFVGDNAEARADLLYHLRAYAGSNPTQLAGLVGAGMTALAASGHLHNKGSDYTPANPRIDISFAHGGTTYHLFLYTGA